MVDCSPEEATAIRLVWEKRGHQGPIPPDKEALILAEIRERASRIEWETAAVAIWVLSEGRRFPRRHQLLVFSMLVVGIAVAILVLLLRSA